MIDVKEIIDSTLRVFEHTELGKLKSVNETDYRTIHTSPLVPLDIKIDIDLFKKEIENFPFEQWGGKHLHLPRYGLAVVNQDGVIKNHDPINGSLHEWNSNNKSSAILETDCLVPTAVMDIESMQPLRIFDNHWCRSNILKWHTGAEFKPHIDTVIPSPWIRLWGTTGDIELNFYNEFGKITDMPKIEQGRIYLIDTSLVHDARCANGTVYQFFLSVLPSAYNIVNSILL
jgi:hypothetical protein